MAYNFTASSIQYLEVADTASLDITGALTLVAWIKSTGVYSVNNKGILNKFTVTPGERSYALSINSSGTLQFAFSDAGTTNANNRTVNGATVVGTNWRHAAGVFTPSTKIEVFLDGASDGVNTTSIHSSIYSGSAPLWIGSGAILGEIFNFDGLIAEAAVYSTNLTADEIKSLATGVTCDKVRPQSLVFYAPLIRDLQDVRGGLAIINNNSATVADHPRVYK
jgi:hypothetical protein